MIIIDRNIGMYFRLLEDKIRRRIGSGKVIILKGAKQTGKSWLIENIIKRKNYLKIDGDDPAVRNILKDPGAAQIRNLIGSHQIIFIDEAQRIHSIDRILKIIREKHSGAQVYITATPEAAIVEESISNTADQNREFTMHPIAWEEFENYHGFLRAGLQLENRLLYGFYPGVLGQQGEEISALKNFVNHHLLRDALAHPKIRKPEILEKLVYALALRIGNEANYTELSEIVSADKNTVMKYIRVLEQEGVVFSLGCFCRNVKNEVRTNRKFYFTDVGVRNMILGNFSKPELRTDINALWENFLIAERRKQISYKEKKITISYWRTTQKQEVNFVEEEKDKIRAFKFRWSGPRSPKFPKTFTQKYSAAGRIITPENFREFVIL